MTLTKLAFTRTTIIKMLALLFCSALVGVLLLTIVYAVPNGHITRHVAESVDILNSEGTHPSMGGQPTTKRNNYADFTIMLHTVSNRGIQPLDAALNNYIWQVGEGNQDYNMPDYLNNFVTNNNMEYHIQYPHSPRYWHGIEVVTRVLFFFFNLSQIRILMGITQALLVYAVLYMLQRQLSIKYAIALAIAIIMLSPYVLWMCMEESIVFIIMLIAMVLLLRNTEWLNQSDHLILFFFMIGVTTVYFDYITYPLVAFGIPLVTVILLRKSETGRDSVHTVFLLTLSWGLGYSFMWMSKWVIRSVVNGTNGFIEVWNQIMLRTSTEGTLSLIDNILYRINAFVKNVSVFFRQPYLFLAAAAIIALLILLLSHHLRIKKSIDSQKWVSLVLLSLIPFAWCFILAEHSDFHYALCTHRILAVSAYAVISLLFTFISKTDRCSNISAKS